MWRALFLSIGVSLAIMGGECLVFEKVVLLIPHQPQVSDQTTSASVAPASATRVIDPPEWAPWSLIASGVVVILYSFTIPKRVKD